LVFGVRYQKMLTNPTGSGLPLLLINPWVYDFAAYDFFARPLGLLYLAGLLERQGYQIDFLDCLALPHVKRGPWGTGRLPKEILPPPPSLGDVPRRYGRYGISETAFRERLSRTQAPAAILVTSLMTYWHPGVPAAIRLAREYFPGAPVILGGIYATLCPEHARTHSGADLVVTGPGEASIAEILAHLAGTHHRNLHTCPEPPDLDALPYPALHLAPHLTFIPLLTSRGCPLACSYCASNLLQPHYQRRRPEAVADELDYWQRRLGLTDVAFYDDALLVAAADHLLPLLEELARRRLAFRFHTPNGLHARLITPEVAHWLKRAGFTTLRLGVETTALGAARLDRKLLPGELEEALAHLKEAGFVRKQLGVYLLLGLPGQDETEVARSITRVKALGASPVLALYSPIPGTALWPQAVRSSRYDLAADPSCHNNSVFPCLPQFSWEAYARLKRLAAA
jgi:hypothetical protein